MTTGCAVETVAPPRRLPPRTAKAAVSAGPSAVRYAGRRNSRAVWVVALALSAAAHAGLLLGFRSSPKVIAAAAPETVPTLRLVIPELKELEEPEVVPSDSDAPPPDPGILVPMQADVPQLVRPNDFVQQLNFASMLEQPDFSKLNVYVVPENIRAGGGKLAEQFGRIFNLSDLDRTPEPVLQPAPMFPVDMRKEAQSARVVVEFIVDVHGRVLDPVVIDTTHGGFDAAALAGVSRWKFRAGVKTGRKVNTRMRVPIIFKLLDPID